MKKIVITGASSGLGKVLAATLATEDNQVYALARSADKLEALREAHPEHLHPVTVDISDSGAVAAAFAPIGPIDVLINNAGVYHHGPFQETKVETIDRVIDTNLKGVMYCTLHALPGMIERKSGVIINISSVSGINGLEGQAAYGASKFGLQGFGEVVAREAREHDVLVTTLCPGGIDTPLWDDKNSYPGKQEDLMSCEEIAELVRFILSRPKSTLYKRVVFFPKSEWHAGG